MVNIKQKRKEVYDLLILKSNNIKSGIINKISDADLRILFDLYDSLFLDNWFQKNFNGRMKFSLSRRMTKSAGMTLYQKKPEKQKTDGQTIEIRMGVEFLFRFNILKQNRKVCGIVAGDSLEALQPVFEHELCHALELIKYGSTSCKGQRFKAMALELFGHTASHHELPTVKEIAQSRLGLNIGDTVTFRFYGNLFSGLLYKINKRATVMVRDENGMFADEEGNRYSKYYIPPELLSNRD